MTILSGALGQKKTHSYSRRQSFRYWNWCYQGR
jgi:hypothetical protein